MSSTPHLQTIEVGPRGQADASVIWMHGLGADGHDFEPIVPELGLPRDAQVRFVFPNAPIRPVTLNGGMRMRAWYDIKGLGPGHPEDAEGIRSSEGQICQLIEQEAEHGVGPEKIVLAGFSQGGAIALHTGLRFGQPLAGIMALSTYAPLRDLLEDEAHDANRDVPIFMAHGEYDQVVPYSYGQFSRDLLQSLGYRVQWQNYRMEHSVVMEEIRDIGQWLRQVLKLG
jgi:phospholipase/carboxylesterase